jgi:hypothetical protein
MSSASSQQANMETTAAAPAPRMSMVTRRHNTNNNPLLDAFAAAFANEKAINTNPPPTVLPPSMTTEVTETVAAEGTEQAADLAQALLMDNDGNVGGVELRSAEELMDIEVKEVMKHRLAKGTRANYERRLVNLMVWLYDNRDKYTTIINPSFCDKLDAANAADNARRTAANRPSKKRDYIRDVCMDTLHNIDSSDASTIPLNLSELTFTIFARYLCKFKRQVRHNEGVGVGIRLSPSSYDGECTALSYLYTECRKIKEETSRELWVKLAGYKKGSRRKGASERHHLGLKVTEGKKPLSLQGLKALARVLFRSEKPEYISAHTFLLMEWNLIARAENCVESNIELIAVLRDALVFDLGKSKTDQEGVRNVDHPWHVYANPLEPEICLVLSLARYLTCHPHILKGNCKLFEGVSQYERYNSIFKQVVKDNPDVFLPLGITLRDFGTHSIRKGAITHVATGCTVCPPMASFVFEPIGLWEG